MGVKVAQRIGNCLKKYDATCKLKPLSGQIDCKAPPKSCTELERMIQRPGLGEFLLKARHVLFGTFLVTTSACGPAYLSHANTYQGETLQLCLYSHPWTSEAFGFSSPSTAKSRSLGNRKQCVTRTHSLVGDGSTVNLQYKNTQRPESYPSKF